MRLLFWILDFGFRIGYKERTCVLPIQNHDRNAKMPFTEQQFKDRTKAVGLRIIRLIAALPPTRGARVIGDQLLRSGTSIGANYRASCRAISVRDIISKLGDVEEETDESMYWIEMLGEAGIVSRRRLESLYRELDEILAMVVASIKTLRFRNPKSKIQNLKSNGQMARPKD
jgi:four helix bundle protein